MTSGFVTLLCLSTLLCLIHLHAVVADDDGFGSLRLCPAGGRSFMMAWTLACEMKRRRKRFAEPAQVQKRDETEYRPATIKEAQQICCLHGCEIRDLLSYCDPFGNWKD